MPVYRGLNRGQEYRGTGASPDTGDYRGIQRYRGSSPVTRLQTGLRPFHYRGSRASPDTGDCRGIQRYQSHPRYPGCKPGQDISITGASPDSGDYLEYICTGVIPGTPVTNRGNTSPLPGYTAVPGLTPIPRLQSGEIPLH